MLICIKDDDSHLTILGKIKYKPKYSQFYSKVNSLMQNHPKGVKHSNYSSLSYFTVTGIAITQSPANITNAN